MQNPAAFLMLLLLSLRQKKPKEQTIHRSWMNFLRHPGEPNPQNKLCQRGEFLRQGSKHGARSVPCSAFLFCRCLQLWRWVSPGFLICTARLSCFQKATDWCLEWLLPLILEGSGFHHIRSHIPASYPACLSGRTVVDSQRVRGSGKTGLHP